MEEYMGLWFFMVLMLLITPFIMIFFGGKFKNNPPDKINWIYGYRTKMSMKNKDTWIFAHKKIGGIWLKSGIILAVISSVCMLPLIGKDSKIIGLQSKYLTTCQSGLAYRKVRQITLKSLKICHF